MTPPDPTVTSAPAETDGNATLAQTTAPESPAGAPEVPGYEIEGEIGRGGMGVVYRARQVSLNRIVALKMLPGAFAEPREVIRFLQEAEVIASIHHPHVLQAFEYGQCGSRPYFTMEYL